MKSTAAAMVVAPSIQPTLTDAAASIPAGKQLESTAPAD